MFIVKKSYLKDKFLTELEIGVLKNNPKIMYCTVFFDKNYYKNDLYLDLKVPLPKSIENSVLNRRAEYLAVRYAAKLLCKNNVEMKKDRSPNWPLGWSGSLSHTDGCAIALVSPYQIGKFIGVDIESIDVKGISDIADAFTSSEERFLLKKITFPYEIALLVSFSVKESVFKALFIEVNYIFDFSSVKIKYFDHVKNKVFLEINEDLSPIFHKGILIESHFLLVGNKVISTVVIG